MTAKPPGSSSPRDENIAAVVREISERKDQVQSYPFEIQFSGEHRCNLRCIQCGATIERNQGVVPLMDERLPLRSLERFEKLKPQIASWKWLSLTGSGETLINPDLPAILGVLTDNDHECTVSFNTNGTLWSRDKARLIVESGVDEIRFSMDGATKATFEGIRVNAKFEKVLEGIRTLISVREEVGASNPKIAFSCNFMRRNIEELPMLVELAHEMGAVHLVANNTIIYAPEMQAEALSAYRPLVRRMLRAAELRAAELGIEFTNYLLDEAGSEDGDEEDAVPSERIAESTSEVTTDAATEPAADPVGEKPSLESEADDAPADSASQSPAPEPVREAEVMPVAEQFPAERFAPSEAPVAVPEARVEFNPPACATKEAEKSSDDASSLAESILPPLEGLPADLPSIVHACQRPWTGLYVENNGFVKVCCFDVQPIGNLDEQGFDEIWNGALARELRSSFLENRPPEGCRNCFIFAAARAKENVFVRPSGSMRSHLDEPGLSNQLSGTALLHGWALDREGVERVELFLDGKYFADAVYGHDRADVEAAFPGYPNGAACGFRFDLDTTQLTEGEHLLVVYVHNKNGDIGDGPMRALTIVR